MRYWVEQAKSPAPCPLSLLFADDGSLEGRTDTGLFNASYTADGQALSISDVEWTQDSPSACQRKLDAWLPRVQKFDVQGMRLWLSADSGAREFETQDVAAGTLAPLLIGLTESHARRVVTTNGLQFRVTEVDGQTQPQTLDFRNDRINVAVASGRVTSASVG